MRRSTKQWKPRTLTILKSLFVLAAAAPNLSCAGNPVPSWNGRLFFGDADRGGLSRNSAIDPDFIGCQDKPRFDDMVCMSRPDFKSFTDTYIGGCEKWRGRPGSIFVEPDVLVELMLGVRGISDLKPGEYVISQ